MGAWLKPSSIECKLDWRIYDPVADGEIFVGSAWRESVLASFAKLVSDKKCSKIDYETWRNLKKEYDYWVIYFAVSVKEPYYPTDVIIEAYNKDTFAEKHFIKQYRLVYHLNLDEDNFGKYLVKTYFHNNFYFLDLDLMGNPIPYDKSWHSGSKDENETYKGNPTVGARILCYQLFPQERKKKNMDAITTTATTATATPVSNLNYVSTDSKVSTNFDWNKVISTVQPIGYGSVSIETDNFAKQDQVNRIDDRLNLLEKTLKKQTNTKKEDKKMKMFNFDFGPIKDNDNIRMSPYGLAVKNSNSAYQAYDKVNGEMMDVDVMNFSGNNFFYKVPVAVDAVSAGDLIIFNRRPCFVFGFSEQGDVIVIDIALGEKKTILPNKSPFGFSFLTKIVSLFDNMMTAPSAENPLGNMWMWAMMDEDNKDFDPMTMMMMSSMMGGVTTEFNPMMLYFLSKDKDSDKNDLLPLMFMMNNVKK